MRRETLNDKITFKSLQYKEVNEAEWSLFSRDNKVIKNIPHTKEALKQNALRSIIQSLKWQQSLCKDFDGRDACQWGWEKEESKTIPL